jgi:hypothetical protein
VVQIQCFSFGSRGEEMRQSVAGRRSGGSELVLAQWKGSVIQCDGVMISARGEAAPGREKGGDDTS